MNTDPNSANNAPESKPLPETQQKPRPDDDASQLHHTVRLPVEAAKSKLAPAETKISAETPRVDKGLQSHRLAIATLIEGATRLSPDPASKKTEAYTVLGPSEKGDPINVIHIPALEGEALEDTEAWNTFLESNPSMEFQLSDSQRLPSLPRSSVYNQKTGAKAYPCYNVPRKKSEMAKPGDTLTIWLTWTNKENEARYHTQQTQRIQKKFNAEITAEKARKKLKEDFLFLGIGLKDASAMREKHRELSERMKRWFSKRRQIENQTIDWDEPAKIMSEIDDIPNMITEQQETERQWRPFEVERKSEPRYRRENNGWVIQADGTLREPDTGRPRKHRKTKKILGKMKWHNVTPEEVALIWECSDTSKVNASSTFTVQFRPKTELSEEQVQTIREIEREIGAEEGSFVVDKEQETNNERLIDSIVSAAPRWLHLRPGTNINLQQLRSTEGTCINNPERRDVEDHVHHDENFSETVKGIEAQKIGEFRVIGGSIEMIAYLKGFSWKLNLRLRTKTDEEKLIPDAQWFQSPKKPPFQSSRPKPEPSRQKPALPKPPKLEPPPTPKKKKIPLPRFTDLSEMDLDTALEEMEANEAAIEDIISANPNIDELFAAFEKIQREIDSISTQLKEMKGKSTKKTELRQRLGVLKEERKELRPKMDALAHEKKRLDMYQERNHELENI